MTESGQLIRSADGSFRSADGTRGFKPAKSRASWLSPEVKETGKAALAGLLIGASIVGAIFLGQDLGHLSQHSAAYSLTIAGTIAGGILGLYLAYRWNPAVREFCHEVVNNIKEKLGMPARTVKYEYVDEQGQSVAIKEGQTRLLNIQYDVNGEETVATYSVARPKQEQ